MSRRRAAQLLLLVGALGVFYFLSRSWPKDQLLRFSLGDAAARVEELRVSYGDDHGVDYHYAVGTAPRVIETQTRIPDGDYVVEIDVAAHGAHSASTRRVHIESGSTTTIDLSRQVPE